MNTKHVRLATVAVALVVGACSTGAASPGASTAPVALSSLQATIVPAPTDTAPPAGTPEPTSVGGGGPQPTPGDIDPCTLLTQAEASAIMGKPLSAGVSAILDPDRVCTFKSGLSEVKLILAPPAPDVATATAYWDAEALQVPAGVTVNTLTEFDRSAYFSGSAAGVSVSALFVISGKYFFDLYCGFPACSQGASLGGAEHIVGRLPGA